MASSDFSAAQAHVFSPIFSEVLNNLLYVVYTLWRYWHRPHFLCMSSALCGEYTQALVGRIQYFLEAHLRFVVNTLRRISSQKRFVVNTLRRISSRKRFVVNTLRRISSQKRFVMNTLRRISSQKRFVVNTLRR